MSFFNLPNELLFAIAKELPGEKSINALARTNRFFFSALNGYLYAHNVRHHHASALDWAIRNANTDTAANSIKNGADINARNSQTLAFALLRKQFDMTSFLLANGADPNCTDSSGETPLWSAIRTRLKRFVQLLLNNGADANLRNNRGETALFQAVRLSYLPTARLLLDSIQGMDVNAIDSRGQTPLHAIILAPRHLQGFSITRQRIFGLLLGRGANAEHADNDGTTPLIQAILGGNEDAVTLLLQHQVDLQRTDQNGDSALHVAVERGNSALNAPVDNRCTSIVTLMIRYGANIEAKDVQGRSPLHLAVKASNEPLVRRLLELRADAGHSDNSGKTPLHMAAAARSERIIELLLRHGAYWKPKDINGLTPSEYAPLGTCESIKYFIRRTRSRLKGLL